MSGREPMGPDELAELEEERDFLLRSLDDLERERNAGDIDEHDYSTLRDGYTARAGAVLRAIADGRADVEGPATPVSTRRRAATVSTIVVVAVVAGVLVMQASGRRGDAGLTGLDVAAASDRTEDCLVLERSGDVAGATECYDDVLESLPANVPALSFRGWLRVREGDPDGMDDLDSAIQLAPDSTAPYVFRAVGRSRAGDATGAVDDLATFFENDPADDEVGLAEPFAETVVDQALTACVSGDVDGSLPAVEVADCYRDVLAVDAGNPTASAYLGWLLARSGADDGRALALLDDAIAAAPSLPPAYVFRAAHRAHLGDRDGAIADLDAFDALDDVAPDERAAADRVRQDVESGRDPLGGRRDGPRVGP